MTENILARLFEHHNWANRRIVAACAALSEAQLDAAPRSPAMGTLRETLVHLAAAQQRYLWDLIPPEALPSGRTLDFDAVATSLSATGKALLALAQDESEPRLQTPFQTDDGYTVQPWVVMVQAINHASEHREQIKSMLTSLGVTPPDIDGWDFGHAEGALVKAAM